jgi:hypothetical protein
MFWCNDDFAVAARAAGAKYFDVINTGRLRPMHHGRPEIVHTEHECQSTPNYCESPQCHKVLFSQRVEVELETFNATWVKVLAKLGERQRPKS